MFYIYFIDVTVTPCRSSR